LSRRETRRQRHFVEIDLTRFGLIAGMIAVSAAATNAGLAQHVSPAPAEKAKSLSAPQSPATVTHSPALATHSPAAPARNAIGLPAPSLAAGAVGPVHGPGLDGPGVNAARTAPIGVGGIHSALPNVSAAPLTAKGALNGSQMGHPGTGAAILGGGATHAPTAVIGRNALGKH
jgi:hypothetical protein